MPETQAGEPDACRLEIWYLSAESLATVNSTFENSFRRSAIHMQLHAACRKDYTSFLLN